MTAYSPENQLWANVLLNAINDAEAPNAPKEHLDYVTKPNPGCNDVCRLAGIEPAGFYARMRDKFGQKPLSQSGPKIDLAKVRLPKLRVRPKIEETPPPPSKPAKIKAPKPKPKAIPRPAKLYTYNGRLMPLSAWADHLGIPKRSLAARLRYGWTIEETLSRPKGWQKPKPNPPLNSQPQPKPQSEVQRSVGPRRKLYTYQGRTLTLGQWSIETGIEVSTLRYRIGKGWGIEKALTAPDCRGKNTTHQLTYGGRTLGLQEWSAETGIPYSTLWNRITQGWPIKHAIETPVRKIDRPTARKTKP